MEVPETRYARSDDAYIGYQVWGQDGVDVLELTHAMNFSIDETAGEPRWLRYERRLASFSRLIRFDPRGIGLSDSGAIHVDDGFETWADDAVAVLDAADVEQTAVVAGLIGSFSAVLLATRHQDRVSSLVLLDGSARLVEAPDYPTGLPAAYADTLMDVAVPEGVSIERADDIALLAPSLTHDDAFRRWATRATRRSVTPTVAHRLNAALIRCDVRGLLPSIEAPTLVIGHRESRLADHYRYLAAHIPDARLVELDAGDPLAYVGDADVLLDEVEEFLTGRRQGAQTERMFAAVMFADIVGSTALVTQLGDRRSKLLLEDLSTSFRREVDRHGGRFVKDTGDGALMTFGQPTQAIAAARSMHRAAVEAGCTVRIGIHAGEIERRGDDIGGIAVHIAARICALGQAEETLVSSTVGDLVAGSGIGFTGRGTHTLRGIEGTRELLAVTS